MITGKQLELMILFIIASLAVYIFTYYCVIKLSLFKFMIIEMLSILTYVITQKIKKV